MVMKHLKTFEEREWKEEKNIKNLIYDKNL